MGAFHKVTTSHVVSAPLASYIVRNGSRFRFSHDFVHLPLTKLCNLETNIEDYVLQTDENEEGETKKSSHQQYLIISADPKKKYLSYKKKTTPTIANRVVGGVGG